MLFHSIVRLLTNTPIKACEHLHTARPFTNTDLIIMSFWDTVHCFGKPAIFNSNYKLQWLLAFHQSEVFASIAIFAFSLASLKETNYGSSAQKLIRRNIKTFRLTIFREMLNASSMLFVLLFECLGFFEPKQISLLKWGFTS